MEEKEKHPMWTGEKLANTLFPPGLKDPFQPERSKREDFPMMNAPDLKTACQGMGNPFFNYVVTEDGSIGKMRCSEHCGNTVSEVQ